MKEIFHGADAIDLLIFASKNFPILDNIGTVLV